MKNMALTEVSCWKSFNGHQKIFSFESKVLKCTTRFGAYIPTTAENAKLPVIYWLSGLTCSEMNFIEKAGAQRYASEHNVIIINPDTSPRNLNIPGDSDQWDFGVAAGFYVDATKEPWKNNYKMFSYVTDELMKVVNDNLPVIKGKQSIMGHSMGGHGALICTLKNPGLYKSVSGLAALCNPTQCSLGVKMFTGYLGPKETNNWSEWDATELVKNYNGPPIELLLDQGTNDEFTHQLLPEHLVEACKNAGIPAILKKRDGYDHSYYYVATFIGEHIKYHAQHLNK